MIKLEVESSSIVLSLQNRLTAPNLRWPTAQRPRYSAAQQVQTPDTIAAQQLRGPNTRLHNRSRPPILSLTSPQQPRVRPQLTRVTHVTSHVHVLRSPQTAPLIGQWCWIHSSDWSVGAEYTPLIGQWGWIHSSDWSVGLNSLLWLVSGGWIHSSDWSVGLNTLFYEPMRLWPCDHIDQLQQVVTPQSPTCVHCCSELDIWDVWVSVAHN